MAAGVAGTAMAIGIAFGSALITGVLSASVVSAPATEVEVAESPAADQGDQGAGSRAAALAMVCKLVESARTRWRAVNAPHLVALVRVGARFERGYLVKRQQTTAA